MTAVSLYLWGVPTARVPGALRRMATHRRPLRRLPGLTFAKLLGTGSGRTFTLRDADVHHWGVLTCWDSDQAADAFGGDRLVRSWDRVADERLHVRLRPLSSRGTWAGRQPFEVGGTTREDVTGPVAAITRARIAPTRALAFWRAVPPVSADLHAHSGLRLAIGVGEAPVGLQGTFSLWADADALTDFAYRRGPHSAVVRRTPQARWYTEELFARFAVLAVDGTYDGRTP
jgi:hypothetical protein